MCGVLWCFGVAQHILGKHFQPVAGLLPYKVLAEHLHTSAENMCAKCIRNASNYKFSKSVLEYVAPMNLV